jgi:hypothetical protein|tara:strand:+ start:148 stop:321 length:174 start_codon:yes stop_codon:yes gene_type:complete
MILLNDYIFQKAYRELLAKSEARCEKLQLFLRIEQDLHAQGEEGAVLDESLDLSLDT